MHRTVIGNLSTGWCNWNNSKLKIIENSTNDQSKFQHQIFTETTVNWADKDISEGKLYLYE